MRRLALLAAVALAALLLAAAALGAWLRLRDPLAALPRDPPGAISVADVGSEPWEGRTVLHASLDGPSVGRVRFVVSLPDPMPSRPMPALVVLGGLRGGTDGIREASAALGDAGPNAVVGYDWPMPRDLPRGLAVAPQVPRLYGKVLSVPGQVEAIVGWVRAQPWCDPARVSLVGISLGAFVTPAAQRLVEARGSSIPWTVLGYGGAPIGAVIAGHPAVRPAWLAPAAGALVDLLLRPVEPSNHLPHLRGRFLVLGAASDQLVARSAADRYRELTPQPRTDAVVAGDHMGVGAGKKELLRRVVGLTRDWLLEQGAIDAARPAGVEAPGPRRTP